VINLLNLLLSIVLLVYHARLLWRAESNKASSQRTSLPRKLFTGVSVILAAAFACVGGVEIAAHWGEAPTALMLSPTGVREVRSTGTRRCSPGQTRIRAKVLIFWST
jgi:hypothetical protein